MVGTENGLMLLDRSGQGKVYNLINRRRFQQMDVLEGLNVLVTISGRWPVILRLIYSTITIPKGIIEQFFQGHIVFILPVFTLYSCQ